MKRKLIARILKVCLVLAVTGVVVIFGLNGYVKYRSGKDISSMEKMKEEDKRADAVLVLGAQVKSDGSLSAMLKERVDMGIQIYEEGLTDRIIMSGDHGRKDYDEVNAMKDYAIEQGVSAEHIFMDHAGFSTYDSMYRAKEIFEVEDIIVVTQQYHLYRAVYDAQAMGLLVKGIACDKAVYSGDTYRKSREVLARIKDVGYTVVKPEPKFLGKAIPVSGNGNATNDFRQDERERR